ncbi:MAG: AbrB/MazE/SpoVT family DNA-binding domain-containing protein [Verrucomicrobiota bacterium]
MKTTTKLTKIGNSQGIRLSKELLGRYAISDALEMETTPDSIILRPLTNTKTTWESTYREMARSEEDWSSWDTLSEDGIPNED